MKPRTQTRYYWERRSDYGYPVESLAQAVYLAELDANIRGIPLDRYAIVRQTSVTKTITEARAALSRRDGLKPKE